MAPYNYMSRRIIKSHDIFFMRTFSSFSFLRYLMAISTYVIQSQQWTDNLKEYCINFTKINHSFFYIQMEFSYWLISTYYFSRSLETYKNVILSSRDLKVHEISIYEILLPFSSWNALVLALVTSIQDMFVLKGQRLQRNAIQQT